MPAKPNIQTRCALLRFSLIFCRIPQANNTYYNNGSNDLGTSMTRFKLAKYKDKDKLPEISKTVGNKD